MRFTRSLTIAVVVAVMTALSIGPAAAAPPGNDTYPGAVPVGVGYTAQLDTTEATTDADDQNMNAFCGAPATDASVWYSFTHAADTALVVDVSASSYSAGVLVATGSPGAFSIVTCGPGSVLLFATAGTTYNILAIDDQFDGGGNGGLLDIRLLEVPPPPTIEVTIDPVGYVTKAGTAKVSGTYTCEGGIFVDVFGFLTQQVGRFTVQGFFGLFNSTPVCDGTPQRWTGEAYASTSKFSGGRSAAFAVAFTCGQLMCADGYAEQRVMLRGERK